MGRGGKLSKAERSKIGRRSKRIGGTFERRVAAMILAAVGERFCKKDCYRTPMSGGHPHVGESDLQISKKLRKVFPFLVEAKHRKTIRLDHFLKPTAELRSFRIQIVAEWKKLGKRGAPAVVMMGARTDVYAMVKLPNLIHTHTALYDLLETRTPFVVLSSNWRIYRFADLLNCVKENINASND